MKIRGKKAYRYFDEGYAIKVRVNNKNGLHEVNGCYLSDGFAIVYYDLTECYSIVTIGTGLKVSESYKNASDVMKEYESNKTKWIKKMDEMSKVVERAKKDYIRFIKEGRWV